MLILKYETFIKNKKKAIEMIMQRKEMLDFVTKYYRLYQDTKFKPENILPVLLDEIKEEHGITFIENYLLHWETKDGNLRLRLGLLL